MMVLGRQTKLFSWRGLHCSAPFFLNSTERPLSLEGLSRKVNTEDGVPVITFMSGSTLN